MASPLPSLPPSLPQRGISCCVVPDPGKHTCLDINRPHTGSNPEPLHPRCPPHQSLTLTCASAPLPLCSLRRWRCLSSLSSGADEGLRVRRGPARAQYLRAGRAGTGQRARVGWRRGPRPYPTPRSKSESNTGLCWHGPGESRPAAGTWPQGPLSAPRLGGRVRVRASVGPGRGPVEAAATPPLCTLPPCPRARQAGLALSARTRGEDTGAGVSSPSPDRRGQERRRQSRLPPSREPDLAKPDCIRRAGRRAHVASAAAPCRRHRERVLAALRRRERVSKALCGRHGSKAPGKGV